MLLNPRLIVQQDGAVMQNETDTTEVSLVKHGQCLATSIIRSLSAPSESE